MTEVLPVVMITGAGSGVGRAVALDLAARGWCVGLIGRTRETLEQTRELAPPDRQDRIRAFPADISDSKSMTSVAREAQEYWDHVDAVVASAGINTPDRAWHTLELAEYHRVVDTNLHGAVHVVQAFLPGMRQRGRGTFVFINSEAGRRASAKSGVPYSVSKFGLAGLAQSLNAEERANGIRACSIFPGDINTPLLDRRPSPPPPEARERMLQPADLAAAVRLVLELPARAVVEELVLQPAGG